MMVTFLPLKQARENGANFEKSFWTGIFNLPKVTELSTIVTF